MTKDYKWKPDARFIALVVLLFTSTLIFAQNNISPLTQLIILQTEQYYSNRIKSENTQIVLPQQLVERHGIQKSGNTYVIGALLEIQPSVFQENDLLSLGGRINARAGNIRSVQLPVENLKKLGLMNGVIYLEAGGKVRPCLDQAREETRVSLVNSGYRLPQAYKGQGVIIGVVDIGLDFTHPMFKDSTGNNLRISRAWIQNDNTGAAPQLFSYGSEYIGAAQLLNKGTDDANTWHGTHVTGIAAGSCFGSNGLFCGVAPAAEIVQVGLDFNSGNFSRMVDAFCYICQYADSVNKPAIVNMSLSVLGDGSFFDGSTLFERSLSNLINDRHILVVAAGNFGATNIHVEKNSLPVSDTLTSVFLAHAWDAVSIWSDPNQSLSASVTIYDSAATKLIQTPVYQTINNPSFSSDYPIPSTGDTVTLTITSQHLSVLNGRSGFYICVESKRGLSYYCSFSAVADSGNIHAWDQPFTSFSNSINNIPIPGAKNGDNNYTLGAPGTVERAITVGAYTTKNACTYISGVTENAMFHTEIGEFAPFSGNGPGFLTGNIKPTITAPGNTLVSAVNSFAASFNDSNSVAAYNNHWYYAPAFGTSMACPMVTGIIALMYEANPLLTRNQVESIIKQTARQDSFTGKLSTHGNPHWGWGKVDAFSAVSLALAIKNDKDPPRALLIYPNPSSDKIIVTITGSNTNSEPTSVSMYNLAGQIIRTQKFPAGALMTMDVGHLPKGFYLVKVHMENKNETIAEKLIIQ